MKRGSNDITGGTIAMKVDQFNAAVPAVEGNELMSMVRDVELRT